MTGQNRTLPRKKEGRKEIVAKQNAFINILPSCNFNISKACRELAIGRSTVYGWLDDSTTFREQYESLIEEQIDIWEEALLKNIKAGDATSIIFALKTKGKHRGWVERESVNQKAVVILENVLAGNLTPREAGYKFALLGLPLPEVLKIELSKQEPEEPGDNWEQGDVIAQIERRAAEALNAVEHDRSKFLPERRAEVAALKKELAHVDSFACNTTKTKGD
ncbi:hypothetical protein [Geobacter sp.]|uniref:hypothetical protein n=1 Tax=Geobacter sp. TaxID=46610 RepID=UPI001AC73A63|nr:hypothetical protein [Geobacter sp.]CAG0994072.1 hypothetical protein ANRL4_02651 [Anaerolineae bacterium]